MAVSLSLSIAQNSQSVTNNTSNVTVKVTAAWTGGSYNTLQKPGWVKIDGTTYDFTSSFNTSRTTSGSKTLYTKTVTISHASDGTKTLSCSASYTTGVSSGTITASASKTLTTIPRKSTLSVSSGTLDTEQTLTVTRQSSSFTHTITATCGSASKTICSKSSSTSISFTPPLSWASQNTTGTSVSVTYKITTYNGDSSVGSNSYSKTCKIPTSVKPSCTVAVTDPTGYLDTYGGYIQGQSKFKVTVTATTAYDSPIASYKVSANGSTYTSSTVTTAVAKTSGDQSITTTVTDKRGRTSSSASASVTVLAYGAPKINKFTVGRCDSDGTTNAQGAYIKASISYAAFTLNDLNTVSCTIQYKKSADTDYTTIAVSTAYTFGDTVVFEADTESSYDIILSVSDAFSTVTKTTSASTAFSIMHWLKSGLGMALGKVAELENVFEVAWQTRLRDHLCVGNKDSYMDGQTGVYINKAGYMHLQRLASDGHPYLGFLVDDEATNCTGLIRVNGTSKNMEFLNATGYKFDNDLTITSPTAGLTNRMYGVNKVLWSGTYLMTADQTVTLSEAVSAQPNGIVLAWGYYNSSGEALNQNWGYTFIPKYHLTNSAGKGIGVVLSGSLFAVIAAKYIYVSDTTIKGYSTNEETGTASTGVTYNNARWVLRYVIGV